MHVLSILAFAGAAWAGNVHTGRHAHPRGLDTTTESSAQTQESLTPKQITMIKSRLAENNKNYSWVWGVQAEMLLELETPELSVFSPSWTQIFNGQANPLPEGPISIAKHWQAQRTSDNDTLRGPPEGSAGDPNSLGVAYLMAAYLGPEETRKDYLQAQDAQIDYMLDQVPHLDDGTISQRAPWEPIQLWDDSVYMTPPNFALYGVHTNNASMVREAWNQCRLYRKHLMQTDTKLWMHVIMGEWDDKNLWGTGISWALAGMTRVAATIKHSPFFESMQAEYKDLTDWSMEIVTNTSPFVNTTTYLMPNVYHAENGTSFSEGASSALIASAIYRLAQMEVQGAEAFVPQAERIRQATYNNIDEETGWIKHVVDPLDWYVEIDQSPEAQAFTLLMESAWRGYTGQDGVGATQAVESDTSKGSS